MNVPRSQASLVTALILRSNQKRKDTLVLLRVSEERSLVLSVCWRGISLQNREQDTRHTGNTSWNSGSVIVCACGSFSQAIQRQGSRKNQSWREKERAKRKTDLETLLNNKMYENCRCVCTTWHIQTGTNRQEMWPVQWQAVRQTHTHETVWTD